MAYCGVMAHGNGFSNQIACTDDNTVTILGFGNSNKLIEASFLTYTGNGSSMNRTIASTIKRYVIHVNGLSNGGSVTVTFTYNGGTQVVLVAAPDTIATFDVT
jgi:hypothetical protein